MQHTKKMVLVPQETLTHLQTAKSLEQTTATRVVCGLDNDMRRLLERQDLPDEDKLKLYHQTLRRYMELNKQRKAPLTLTVEPHLSDVPPKLKRESDYQDIDPPQLEPEGPLVPPRRTVLFKDEGSQPNPGVPAVFAEASHLPLMYERDEKTKKMKKKKSKKTSPRQKLEHKWTPY